MPRRRSQTLRCPTCRSLVTRTDADFPFCSERCRLVDLGKWASGGYVISTAITDPEALESIAEQDATRSRRDENDEDRR